MRIIEIKPLENGSHRNQTGGHTIPPGWAVIPEGMELQGFPFGEVAAEEIDGVMTVTGWVPGEIPPEPQPEPQPDPMADVDGMLVDHELRITLLELGVSE